MSAARRIVSLRLNSAHAMRGNSTLILSLVFLLAAVFSVTGNLSARPWLHGLFTPLATMCILALASFQLARVKKTMRSGSVSAFLLAARRHRSPSPRALFPSWANRFPVYPHRLLSCLHLRHEISCALVHFVSVSLHGRCSVSIPVSWTSRRF